MDVSALSEGVRSGTAVYLYRLAQALSSLGADLDLHLLYNGNTSLGADLAHSLAGDRVRVLSVPLLWSALPGPLFWRPYPAALTAAAYAADVFHVGEFVFPALRRGTRVVATVHDCTTKLFPQWHMWQNRLLHRRRLRWVKRYAARVIIDAESTRADTARSLGWPSDRFDVVPLARGTSAEPGRLVDVRSMFGLGDAPYVLFVGTLEPRKNVVRLIDAFVKLSPCHAASHLVLAGHWGWHVDDLRQTLANAGPRVVVTGGVDADTLAALYREATVFAYPSLYEGFGLPVLEAMAAGVPVVTSAGGTLEEIAGGAAQLVDPLSSDSIREGIECVLGSPQLREELRARGFVRESEFTWQRTAQLTLDTWRRTTAQAS